MNGRHADLTPPVFITAILACISACVPDSDRTDQHAVVELEPHPVKAAYRSAKRVSSDCGVEFVARPPPGFAEMPGVEQRELPERVAGFLAVGADRELVATDSERVSPGYVLIEPGSVRKSLLINNDNEVVASFKDDYHGGFAQFLPNGNRLVSSNVRTETFARGGGYRGCVEEYTADGKLVWRLNLSTENYIHHHDVVPLDNGNILAVVWEKVSADEAISQGRDPEHVAEDGNFWYDGVIEVNPYTLDIVWEWSARHHMVQDFDPAKPNHGIVADHPELLDLNAFRPSDRDGTVSADWTHVNAIDYNPALEQILLSTNYLSEIWILDHSTTPQESAGHSGGRYGKGGDLMYRWGNPLRYDRGTDDERMLFHQHDAQWIDPGLPGEGHILIFNNGHGKAQPYSTVVELAPEMNADGSYVLHDGEPYGPDTLVWEYNPEPPERFFSHFISGAQRLPNGNTLIDQGAGAKVREVTASGEIVWEYAYTDDIDAPHMLFRANRYAPDHPGIVSLLVPGD